MLLPLRFNGEKKEEGEREEGKEFLQILVYYNNSDGLVLSTNNMMGSNYLIGLPKKDQQVSIQLSFNFFMIVRRATCMTHFIIVALCGNDTKTHRELICLCIISTKCYHRVVPVSYKSFSTKKETFQNTTNSETCRFIHYQSRRRPTT